MQICNSQRISSPLKNNSIIRVSHKDNSPLKNNSMIRVSHKDSSSLKKPLQPHAHGLYRLVYHNMRGRAELIRLIFTAADVQFCDERVERSAWPAVKALTPGGVLPYLVTPEGDVMVQSMAIARYLAREFDLYGDTSFDMYRIERAVGQLHDLSEEVFKVLMCDKADNRSQMLAGCQLLMHPLEDFLKENNNLPNNNPNKPLFYAGDRASMADLFSVAVVDWMILHFDEQFFNQHPLLLSHYKRIGLCLPKVRQYLNDVPKLPY